MFVGLLALNVLLTGCSSTTTVTGLAFPLAPAAAPIPALAPIPPATGKPVFVVVPAPAPAAAFFAAAVAAPDGTRFSTVDLVTPARVEAAVPADLVPEGAFRVAVVVVAVLEVLVRVAAAVEARVLRFGARDAPAVVVLMVVVDL